MKVAIPTNDAIHISHGETIKGFHVFNVELGEITEEELRWRKLTGNQGNTAPAFEEVNDCSVILVNKSWNYSKKVNGSRIIPVDDTIITKIILNYLLKEISKEADTCCCP